MATLSTTAERPSAARALSAARRIVVKIGSALLVDWDTGRPHQDTLDRLCADVARMRSRGQQVLVVSSGAVALGRRRLGLPASALQLDQRQAAAAAGQSLLMHAWETALAPHGLAAAQILLTRDDTETRRRWLNARATVEALLALGAVPVVNENDTVATEEIRYGDNDRLAARAAQMIGADVLALLSDVDGLYDADPRHNTHARRLDHVAVLDAGIEAMAGAAAGSTAGTGGMATKVQAARIAGAAGCATVITLGRRDRLGPLEAVEAGHGATLFAAPTTPRAAWKLWIAGSLAPKGQLVVDDGCAKALARGASLLAAGLGSVEGRFEKGDAVVVRDLSGRALGRGIARLDAADAARVVGLRSEAIEAALGWAAGPVVIHADDMALDGCAMSLNDDMLAMGRAARSAARDLATTPAERRTAVVRAMARALAAQAPAILAANARDLDAAREKHAAPALLDRLALDPARLKALADATAAIADIPDPVGHVTERWVRPNGLDISRVRTPIGVLAMIYESRPNVTVDAAALAVRSGNAVILRGGSDCLETNRSLHVALAEALRSQGLNAASVQLVPTADRDAVGLILSGLDGTIDLIIPRGGRSLVERVRKEARVAVLGHLEGVNHVYVHAAAVPDMARAVVLNAKMRRVSVCGAAETLLIDRAVAPTLLPLIAADLEAAGCAMRGDGEARALWPAVGEATEADWSAEYLDAILAMRVVDGLGAAIEHIAHHGSGHTEAIVTADDAVAERFLSEVDAAIVLRNASTQFADGGEFGFGAEIGIATDRLHARGPVGAEQLTTFKYVVRGSGQIRA